MTKTVNITENQSQDEIIRDMERKGYVCVGRDGTKLVFESSGTTGKTLLNG